MERLLTPQIYRRLAPGLIALVCLAAAACGRKEEKKTPYPESTAAALTMYSGTLSATDFLFDKNGHSGHLCLTGLGANECSIPTTPLTLGTGQYLLYTNGSFAADGTWSPGLVLLTVANNVMTVPSNPHVKVVGNTLVLQTAPLTVSAPGLDGDYLFFDWSDVAPFPRDGAYSFTRHLLIGRRYQIQHLNSLNAEYPAVLYRVGGAADIFINETADPTDVTGGTLDTFTWTSQNRTLTARTKDVVVDLKGYYGLFGIGAALKNGPGVITLKVLSGRNYIPFDYGSYDLALDSYRFSQMPELAINGAGTISIGAELGRHLTLDTTTGRLIAKVGELRGQSWNGYWAFYGLGLAASGTGTNSPFGDAFLSRRYMLAPHGAWMNFGPNATCTPNTFAPASWGGSVTLECRPKAPDAPILSTPTPLSGSRIRLDWTGFSGAVHQIQRSLNGAAPWKTVADVAAGTFTFTDSGLLPATTYHYRAGPVVPPNDPTTFSPTVSATTLGSCVNDADGVVCAGDACNGSKCQSGACLPAAPHVCPGPANCRVFTCDPTFPGLCRDSSAMVGSSCSDTIACNGTETCGDSGLGGVACLPGTPVPLVARQSCDDSNPCTDDTVCDGSGACGAGSVRTCSDGNPCTKDVCDPTAPNSCRSTADVTMESKFCGSDDGCASKTCQSGTCTLASGIDSLCLSEAATTEDGVDESDPSAVFAAGIEPTGPAGSTIVGALQGTAGVSPSGEATYSIPIWTPPGRQGIEPELTLEYGSRRGQDLLGPRWSIAGLSAIRRCPRDPARTTHDLDATIFDANASFCLDGKRLTTGLSGEPGPPTAGTRLYEQEDPTRKITVSAVDSLGPVSFEVRNKDGTIAYYGRTSASRAEGFREDDGGVSLPPRVRYAWLLDRVEDRASIKNFMEISYCCVTPSNDAFHDKAVEPRPTEIRYTGSGSVSGSRVVAFVYRTFAPARTRYVGGLSLRSDRILDRIDVSGPLVGTVRSYRMGYTSSVTTGSLLLKSVQECDGNQESSVCTPATEFEWQKNDGFTEQSLTPEISDMGDSRLIELGYFDYRRIVAADLNGDGRDDIIYRGYDNTNGHCKGWYSRLSTGRGFGPPAYHGFSSQENSYMCPGPAHIPPPPNASVISQAGYGDVFPGDIDRDGRDDLIVPSGNGSNFDGYAVYFNDSAATDWNSERDVFVRSTIDSLSSSTILTDPRFFVGDASGAGSFSIYRPSQLPGENAPIRWREFAVSRLGIFPRGIPDFLPDVNDRPYFSLNLDGVGRTEFMRAESGGAVYSYRSGRDQRLEDLIAFGGTVAHPVWFLDFNGDGFMDVVKAESSTATSILAKVHSGVRFGAQVATELPATGRIGLAAFENVGDSGVRIIDFNLDGRDDILLVDNGVRQAANGIRAPTRAYMVALVSLGDGAFLASPTDILVGDFADGAYEGRPGSALHAYRTTQVLDVNGDGLSDIVSMRDGKLRLHLRDGKEPDVILKITDGQNVVTDFSYASIDDATTVSLTPNGCNGNSETKCGGRGVWFTKTMKTSAEGSVRTWTHSYENPLAARHGEGFLGVLGHRVQDSLTGQDVKTVYETPNRKVLVSDLVYRGSMTMQGSVKSVEVTSPLSEGRRRVETRTFTYDPIVPDSHGSYFTTPAYLSTETMECPGNGAGCRLLSSSFTTYDFDGYGNLISEERDLLDATLAVRRHRSRSAVFEPANEQDWLVARVRRTSETETWPGKQSSTTHQYETDPSTGLLNWFIVEPDSTDASKWLKTILGRNPRGQVETVTRQTLGGSVRTDGLTYDGIDGVFPASRTNAKGQTLVTWIHPIFGTLVRMRDLDQRLSRGRYDRFGRPKYRIDAKFGEIEYFHESDAGRRQIRTLWNGTLESRVSLDALGRPVVTRSKGGDGREIVSSQAFDLEGRLVYRIGPAFPNESGFREDIIYDSVGRQTSHCRDEDSTLDAQGNPLITRVCRTSEYRDNLLTETDERGRITRAILDPLGREIETTAEDGVTPGVITTRHSYGRFGRERSEILGAPSVVNEVEFDGLGRKTYVSRSGAGGHRYTYNAFGDLEGDQRLKANGTVDAAEATYYTPDALGRLRFSSGPDGVSEFRWDPPNATGALAGTTSADGVQTERVYNSRGLAESETWTIAGENFTVGTTYDEFGRPKVLSYPGHGAPFSVLYEYNPISGDASRLTRVQDGTEYWKAAKRNAFGALEEEVFGGSNVASATFYPRTGRVHTKALNALQLAETVSYYADGSPKGRERDGYRETFAYDGLNRLWQWFPDELTNSPVVTYKYDTFGNLKTRSVSDEIVTYSHLNNSALESLHRARGGESATEALAPDDYGRTRETALGTIAYTAFDLPRTFSGKGGAPSFAYKYDAYGTRALRTGASALGDTVISVAGLYERRSRLGAEHLYRVKAEGRVVAEVTVQGSSAATKSVIQDSLGSVTALVDEVGRVVRAPRRDPFGATMAGGAVAYLSSPSLAARNTSESSRPGYRDHLHEEETGWIEMGARAFDPRLGRFLSADPVSEATSVGAHSNPWTYALNNPLAFYDPDGRQAAGNPAGAMNASPGQPPSDADAEVEEKAPKGGISIIEAGVIGAVAGAGIAVYCAFNWGDCFGGGAPAISTEVSMPGIPGTGQMPMGGGSNGASSTRGMNATGPVENTRPRSIPDPRAVAAANSYTASRAGQAWGRDSVAGVNPFDVAPPGAVTNPDGTPIYLADGWQAATRFGQNVVRFGRKLTREQALRRLLKGGDVATERGKVAMKLGKDASPVAKATAEGPHKPGQMRHVHPLDAAGKHLKNSGHIFFDKILQLAPLLDFNGDDEVNWNDALELMLPPGYTTKPDII